MHGDLCMLNTLTAIDAAPQAMGRVLGVVVLDGTTEITTLGASRAEHLNCRVLSLQQRQRLVGVGSSRALAATWASDTSVVLQMSTAQHVFTVAAQDNVMGQVLALTADKAFRFGLERISHVLETKCGWGR